MNSRYRDALSRIIYEIMLQALGLLILVMAPIYLTQQRSK